MNCAWPELLVFYLCEKLGVTKQTPWRELCRIFSRNMQLNPDCGRALTTKIFHISPLLEATKGIVNGEASQGKFSFHVPSAIFEWQMVGVYQHPERSATTYVRCAEINLHSLDSASADWRFAFLSRAAGIWSNYWISCLNQLQDLKIGALLEEWGDRRRELAGLSHTRDWRRE